MEASLLRGDLSAGAELRGPALCAMSESTLLIGPGLVVRGGRPWDLPAAGAGVSALDPIELQVVSGALHAACEEMGLVLIRSAHSSNIKERRDASTALFDPDGEMVMQAEHIPVHLGSMPAAVAAVLGEHHAPGVSWILNDPFAGGTHLPDITVITPVFAGGSAARCSASPPAAPITPTWAEGCPGRCPPTAAPSRRRAS